MRARRARCEQHSYGNDTKNWILTLAVGVAIAGSLPAKADQPVDYWSVRGLTRPGAWFQKYNTEKPATIGVSKSGQGVGEQKPAKSEVGKKHTPHRRTTKKSA
jgi:hypothetical protein